MSDQISAFQGLWLVSAALLVVWPVAVRLLGSATPAERLAASGLVLLGLLVGLFWALASVGLFGIFPAVMVLTVLAAAALWACDPRRAWAVAKADLAEHAADGRAILRSWVVLPLVLVVGVVLSRVLRGLVAPPLAWDSLTYHYLKAGRWVQAGRLTPEAAPDSWSCYEFYPAAGDILWAWAMLPTHSDQWLALANLLTWIALLVGAYAAARALGVGLRGAVLGSLLVGTMPAALSTITSGHIQNIQLAVLLFTVSLLPGLAALGERSVFGLVGLGCGLLLALQYSSLPFIAWLVLFAACVPIVQRRSLSGIALAATCFGIAALAVSPGMLSTWIRTGSPIFPITLGLASSEAAGAVRFDQAFFSADLPAETLETVWHFLHLQFGWMRPRQADFTNLGPGLALLALPAVAGAVSLVGWGPRRRRLLALWCLGLAAVNVASFASPRMVALRVLPELACNTGRFVLPAAALVLLFAVSWRSRLMEWFAAGAILAQVWLSLPHGYSAVDVEALELVAVGLLLVAAIPVAAVFLGRAHPRAPLIAASAAAVVWFAASSVVADARSHYRYSIWRAADLTTRFDPPSFDLTPLSPDLARAWTVWQRLDGPEPQRIAFVSGWRGGPTWFRYPLLGHRLQNEVIYVSPLPGGGPLHLFAGAPVDDEPHRRAWLQRLQERDVDWVVAVSPETIELQWMSAAPSIFDERWGSKTTRLFRIDTAALSSSLEDPSATR